MNSVDNNAIAMKALEAPEIRQRPTEEVPPDPLEQSRIGWSIVILAAAAGLRFCRLGLMPAHHDEAINGIMVASLYNAGFYVYNPAFFHGPTLYYLGLVITRLHGLFSADGVTLTAMRCVPALFSMATIGLVLGLRKQLGTWGALTAAALIAVSPGQVFVPREFIHEAVFVFCSLAIVMAAFRYRQTASPSYLRITAGLTAFLFATKETAFITVLVLGLAYGCTVAYLALLEKTRYQFASEEGSREPVDQREHEPQGSPEPGPPPQPGAESKSFVERAGGPRALTLQALGAAAVFLFVYIGFFSSFGSNFRGVRDSFSTFAYWSEKGVTEHVKNQLAYGYYLVHEELPALFLGALGIGIALYHARNRFAVFCSFWALGIFSVYSIIPYKTPWLTINLQLPFALAAGYAMTEIFAEIQRRRRPRLRLVALAVLLVSVIFSACQTLDLTFVRYDHETIPYVYGHTLRTFLPLLDDIDRVARSNGRGSGTVITVTTQDCFPLPWYLRGYWQVRYWERLMPNESDIIIVRLAQDAKLRLFLTGRFARMGVYPVRRDPNTALVLYVRRDEVR
jgi:uncharacterized protein (TIGR03663 family)